MNNFENQFILGKRKIKNYGLPYVIAEIGSNYDQNLKKAIRYVELSKKLGADCVKFQLFKASNFFEENNKNFNLFKKNELPINWLKKISNHCKKKKIDFMCSPFSADLVIHLRKINVTAYKIASSELLNFDLLHEVAKQKKPIFLSTGMASFNDVILSLNYLRKKRVKKLALLQCTSNYPTEIHDLNLNVIDTYKRSFENIPVGLSDHSNSVLAPALAVSKGACVIEKHLTLNKSNLGPDHSYAMDPQSFKIMMKNINVAFVCNGSANKKKHLLEEKFGRKKGIYYKKNLKKGRKISFSLVKVKNFKVGIKANDINKIINKKITKDVKINQPIRNRDFT